MGKHSGAVHVARVVRKYKDREYVSWLLRRSYRQAGKVKHETLANLSALPAHAIADLRASLAGHRLVDAGEALQMTRSLPHGRRLAKRHLARGGLVYYSLSLPEGRCCPLAACGDTGDLATLTSQVQQLRDRFGTERMVLVGDPGVLTAARIDALRELGGVGWITTLRTPQVAAFAEQQTIRPSLFDQANLAEVSHPDYPGERLVVRRDAPLGAERARKRGELLAATQAELDEVATGVQAGTLAGAADIGVKVGLVLGRFNTARHFRLDITDSGFGYTRDQPAIDAEAAMDGIDVIRTSVTAGDLDPDGVAAAYKRFAGVR